MLIDIISPAGSHLDLAAFDLGCSRLQSMGHALNVRAPREAWQRFGGDDEARLNMIHEAARGPAGMVLLTRGGYGLSRLLDRIDWSLVATAVRRGQIWAGFSDFTAFQAALYASTGARSFAGPTVSADFGAQVPNALMLSAFDVLVKGGAPDITWNRTPTGSDRRLKAGHVAEGVLWGGNLSMLTSLVGSKWMPDPAAPSMLWIEDVAEHPYRVERMLHQLYFAGILQKQKAILLGSFNQWKPAAHDGGYDLEAVLQYFNGRLREACGEQAPVWIEGLPFGHQALKTVIEFGGRYGLHIADETICLKPLR